MKLDADEVKLSEFRGKYLVASSSGTTWYLFDWATAKCDCPAGQREQHCYHADLVRQYRARKGRKGGEMAKEFVSIVRPGVKLRVDKDTLHIRAVVDRKVVIYRVWRRGKWQYGRAPVEDLQKLYDAGALTNGRKKPRAELAETQRLDRERWSKFYRKWKKK